MSLKTPPWPHDLHFHDDWNLLQKVSSRFSLRFRKTRCWIFLRCWLLSFGTTGSRFLKKRRQNYGELAIVGGHFPIVSQLHVHKKLDLLPVPTTWRGKRKDPVSSNSWWKTLQRWRPRTWRFSIPICHFSSIACRTKQVMTGLVYALIGLSTYAKSQTAWKRFTKSKSITTTKKTHGHDFLRRCWSGCWSHCQSDRNADRVSVRHDRGIMRQRVRKGLLHPTRTFHTTNSIRTLPVGNFYDMMKEEIARCQSWMAQDKSVTTCNCKMMCSSNSCRCNKEGTKCGPACKCQQVLCKNR